MKYELKSIGYWSVIKVSFILNLIVGFIMGFFFAIFVSLMISIFANLTGFMGAPIFEEEVPPIGLLIIIYPIMFSFGGAVFNTILAVLVTFVYNLIGRLLGGLELELSEIRLQPAGLSVQSESAITPGPQTPPPPPPPVQPLPPDISPPDTKTDESHPSGKDKSDF
jgi:hypothetical protein